MVIADIFDIRGRGIVVLGKIESGNVRIGDVLTLSHGGLQTRVSVISMEKFQQDGLQQASAGPDDIGIGLHGAPSREDIPFGSLLLG